MTMYLNTLLAFITHHSGLAYGLIFLTRVTHYAAKGIS